MKVKQTLSLDEENLKDMKHLAIDKNMSLSDLVDQAIKDYLDKERRK